MLPYLYLQHLLNLKPDLGDLYLAQMAALGHANHCTQYAKGHPVGGAL